MRILYTELKMGKVFIQLRTGKGMTAYVVDEDRTAYTCRKELYQPEEFVVKRSDILFMAEKNPSALQVAGEVGAEKVTLTWLPPYGEVKKYNLYIKQNEKDKYELAGSSKTKTITLEKLKSNTSFFLIVTSVDAEDYESPPSNEIRITTANIRPGMPVVTSGIKNDTGGILLTWNPSFDPDGKVTKYRIYISGDDKREQLAEVNATEYAFSDMDILNRGELVSVDDRGDESAPMLLAGVVRNFTISAYPGMILPLGKFGKIVNPGFGISVSFALNNWFYEKLTLATEIGFYSFMGKDALAGENKKTKTFIMVPVLMTTGYNFKLNEKITLTPVIGAGITYLHADFINRDSLTRIESSEKLTEIGPLVTLGLRGSYQFTESLKGAVRMSFGYLAGSENGIYAGCDAGCIYIL
jgi:hypothetical protein